MDRRHERAGSLARLWLLTNRLSRWLVVLVGVYASVAIVLTVAFGMDNVPHQDIWQELVPMLLFAALLALAVGSALVAVLYRRHKRALTHEVEHTARQWVMPDSAAAKTGGRATLVGVSGFRAHAVDPHTVDLTWNPPLESAEEFVVLRSTSGFAASMSQAGDQTVVYEGGETRCDDVGLEDDRVFFYTAFARAGAEWSSPAISWTTTPRLALLATVLGSLRLGRVLFFPWQHPSEAPPRAPESVVAP